MSGLRYRLACRALSAAARLLPPGLCQWPRAMERELAAIGDERAALHFALGCVRAVVALAAADRLRALAAGARSALVPIVTSARSHSTMTSISARPRLLGLVCAAAAAAIGLAYLAAAGAPFQYLLVNLAALVLGATAWLALGRAAGSALAAAGPAILALSVPLLLTALFGFAVEGAARWLSVGPLSLQVSLILLPAMIVLYARRPDPAGTAGMIVAALALALQPDRAMAGVLVAGLLALCFARPARLPAAAAAAASLAFGWTLLRPDALPAVPFVDRILYTAFDIHPIAGSAVVLGAALLLVPALAGAPRRGEDRAALLTFGCCWSGVVLASALGNYPTPLVGYGGSAVLGYLLSASLLPGAARRSAAEAGLDLPPAAGRGSDPAVSELRVVRLA